MFLFKKVLETSVSCFPGSTIPRQVRNMATDRSCLQDFAEKPLFFYFEINVYNIVVNIVVLFLSRSTAKTGMS